MEYGLNPSNDPPLPLHELKDKQIFNDDSCYYMGIENSEITSSVEETEVVFTSVEKAQIKRTLPNMLSFHELSEKKGILNPKK